MVSFRKKYVSRFFGLIPILILFFLVCSDTNFNFEELSFLSFNLIYIVIFYWVLKNPDILGYGFIFLAGVVNDVIIGLPIGVSPITYLILAGFAAYVRYLTVEPSLIYDWVIFVPSIAVTNSVYFYILRIFFDIDVNYIALAVNTSVTILLYPIIGILFNLLSKIIIVRKNV
jgi:cell shape-determining protein MreD